MKNNKRISCIALILISFSVAFGQTVMFQKIIEPAQYVGRPNLKSKDVLQRKFFPDNNGIVEFFEVPSFRPELGFRIVKKDDSRYVLEIKQIGNWQEIKIRLDEEYPLQIPSKTIPKEKRDEMNRVYKENTQRRSVAQREMINEYWIVTKDINISEAFSNEIYNAFVILIGNYKSKDNDYVIQPDGSKMIISRVQFDGSQMTFRCVVENELWSFTIGKAFNKIDKLTEICNEIMQEGTRSNNLDERKYIKQLKELVIAVPLKSQSGL